MNDRDLAQPKEACSVTASSKTTLCTVQRRHRAIAPLSSIIIKDPVQRMKPSLSLLSSTKRPYLCFQLAISGSAPSLERGGCLTLTATGKTKPQDPRCVKHSEPRFCLARLSVVRSSCPRLRKPDNARFPRIRRLSGSKGHNEPTA